MDIPEYQAAASSPAADSEDQRLCFSLAVMSFTASRRRRQEEAAVEWWKTGGSAAESASRAFL